MSSSRCEHRKCMRRFLTLAAFLASLSVFAGTVARAGTAPPPNVVVILADDLGWADWGHAGGVHGSTFYETPNLDALATESVVFPNAYASAPTCSPSRHALLTGESPARSHFTEWVPGWPFLPGPLLPPASVRRGIDPASVTLAETLRGAGYRTAIVGKWHLGLAGEDAADPTRHGFEVNIGGSHRGSPYSYFPFADGSFGLPGLGPGTSEPGTYLTDALTEATEGLIHGWSPGDTPFFLFVSHYAVHSPFEAPQALVDKYAAKLPSGGHGDAVYAAMIESLDDSVGRILAALDAEGERSNTIVVFASDNGGLLRATSNRPLRAGKGQLYEGGVRVPLMIRFPADDAIPAGVERNVPTATHDLYPTLLDLAGVPVDPQQQARLDGVSLRGVLEENSVVEGPLYWHLPHLSPGPTDDPAYRYVSSIRLDDWKAIYFYENQSWQLYDLATDPGEQNDLVDDEPEIAGQLGHELVDWLVESNAQLPRDFDENPVPLPTPVPEPGAEAVLAALLVLAALRRRRASIGHRQPADSPGSGGWT